MSRTRRPRLAHAALATLALGPIALAHEAHEVTTPGKAGGGGLIPRLAGYGPAAPLTDDLLVLDDAAPNSLGSWVVGLSEAAVIFQDGVLGPTLDVVLPAVPTDALGRSELPVAFPANSQPGMRAWVQAWVADPGATFGVAASNTLALTIQPGPPAERLFLGATLWSATDPLANDVSDLEVADLDADGRPDLVACLPGAFPGLVNGELLVFAGVGHGHLDEPRAYELDHSAAAIRLGDVDGDGLLDVVSKSSNLQLLHLSHGQAGGGYLPAAASTLDGVWTGAYDLGDIDGDAREDIVTLDITDVIRWWGDDGQGGLLGGPSHAGVPGTVDARLGDADADGDLDLISIGSATPQLVSVLHGHGDGTFGARFDTILTASTAPVAMALGDLQTDGLLDVVVVHAAGVNVVLHGQAQGGLAIAHHYAGSPHTGSAVLADLDGDGQLDLASSGISGLSMRRGLGNGQLGARWQLAGGLHTLAPIDLDGDGDAELAGRDVGGITVLDPSGGPQLNTAGHLATGVTGLLDVADVDGDGTPDLLAGSSTQLAVHRGHGDGSFGAPVASSTTLFVDAASVHHFGGTGLPDVLVTHPVAVSVLRGAGGGQFGPPTVFDLPFGVSVRATAVGDVDGNGAADIAVGDSGGSVSVRFGSGLGDFSQPVELPGPTFARELALADVDLDGDLDMAALQFGAEDLLVFPGTGSTTFGAPLATPLDGTAPAALALGDVDADGWPDLLTSGSHFGQGLWVARGQGDGTFGTPEELGGSLMQGVELADLNGDGHLDAVGGWGPQFSLHLGRGDGSFVPTVFAMSGADHVADLDGDGAPDLVGGDPAVVRLNRRP